MLLPGKLLLHVVSFIRGHKQTKQPFNLHHTFGRMVLGSQGPSTHARAMLKTYSIPLTISNNGFVAFKAYITKQL